MDDVYVVEVATTGPKGAPSDRVAEIAVCKVLSDGSDYDTVYHDGVSIDPLDLGKGPLDYMESNFGILPEDLYEGSPEDRVVSDFQRAVFGRECTSYNVGNVFGKHLNFEPWDATRNLTLLPSISVRLPADLRGPPEEEHLLIRRAYDAMCPGDPAGVGDGRRAMDLAQMSASVAALLRRQGLFRSGSQPHAVDPDGEVVHEHQCQASEVHQRVDDPAGDCQEQCEQEHGEPDGRDEEQEAERQCDVSPLLPRVPVDESETQQSDESGDDR